MVADAVVIVNARGRRRSSCSRPGKTSREVGAGAVRQLRDVKARIFGAVLNDLDLQKYGQYAYYYQYGYY